jgi:hypothetical protein
MRPFFHAQIPCAEKRRTEAGRLGTPDLHPTLNHSFFQSGRIPSVNNNNNMHTHMKTNHRIHASPCATSHARHTSSMRFFTKILPALAMSLFALTLATPDAEGAFSIKKAIDKATGAAKPDNKESTKSKEPGASAKAETGTQITATNKDKEAQDMLNLLTPQITLCKSLQKANSSVEIRGRDYQEILKVLKAFNDLDYNSYSEVMEILGSGGPTKGRRTVGSDIPKSSLQERFLKAIEGRTYLLFLKTSFKISEDAKGLIFINYEKRRDGGSPGRYRTLTREEQAKMEEWLHLSASSKNEWKEHPDGIGYVYQWSQTKNPGLIVVATEKESAAFFKTVDEYRREKLESVRKLWQKVELGELTEKEFFQNRQEIIKEANESVMAKFLKWVESL